MTFMEARIALQLEAEERIGSALRRAVEIRRAREDAAAAKFAEG